MKTRYEIIIYSMICLLLACGIGLAVSVNKEVDITVTGPSSCGPDPAPPPAANAAYNCQTYHWGPGDTAGEIDNGSGAPGKKLYLATALVNGHATLNTDFTVTSGGKIVIQTAYPPIACPSAPDTCDHGAFVLNTCYAPTGSPVWTSGQFFQNGYFIQFVGEWNANGFPGVQTGFYGYSGNWANPYPVGCASIGGCWENDSPDAFALGQAPTNWDGGTNINISNPGQTFGAPTVETGSDKWGSLVTATATTYWVDHGSGYVANGTADFASRGFTPAQFYGSKQCFGPESTRFPEIVDSIDVWQPLH